MSVEVNELHSLGQPSGTEEVSYASTQDINHLRYSLFCITIWPARYPGEVRSASAIRSRI